MEIQKIRYHPLVDANSEGTEKVPVFLTTDPKGVRSMYLEEMIPGYFRLYSKEPVSTGESNKLRIHCAVRQWLNEDCEKQHYNKTWSVHL